jgi:hypothetical protein
MISGVASLDPWSMITHSHGGIDCAAIASASR